MGTTTTPEQLPAKKRHDRTHWLYISVIIAVVAGVFVGLALPRGRHRARRARHVFVCLIKMMIAPIIFCTIVLGVGSVAGAATVGKIGGLALVYFIGMSTIALAIGLVVGNLLAPGRGMNLSAGAAAARRARQRRKTRRHQDFILGIIPTSLLVRIDRGQRAAECCSSRCSSASRCRRWAEGKPIMTAVGTSRSSCSASSA